jgi:Zn-dependent M28 family amino/carboxypeptidase
MRLRALLEGGPIRVRMEVCAHQSTATSWNVIGEIPGASDERVTVGAHYDSWDVGPCVIDNGSGVAAMLEIARVAVALGPHERTLRFVSFGAEELGIQGAIAYGLKHRSEIRRLCRLMVNMDMLGTTHASLEITAVSPELKCLVDALIQSTGYTERTGFNARLAEIPALGTDCTPFVILGVPTMSMGKYPFIYYHTEYDTIDKVDWNDLYASTLICAMATLQYADPDPDG